MISNMCDCVNLLSFYFNLSLLLENQRLVTHFKMKIFMLLEYSVAKIIYSRCPRRPIKKTKKRIMKERFNDWMTNLDNISRSVSKLQENICKVCLRRNYIICVDVMLTLSEDVSRVLSSGNISSLAKETWSTSVEAWRKHVGTKT